MRHITLVCCLLLIAVIPGQKVFAQEAGTQQPPKARALHLRWPVTFTVLISQLKKSARMEKRLIVVPIRQYSALILTSSCLFERVRGFRLRLILSQRAEKRTRKFKTRNFNT